MYSVLSRVNDYLLAVNGIATGNQTTEEIQEFLDTLPTGTVRLTVSAMPPTSTSYGQGISSPIEYKYYAEAYCFLQYIGHRFVWKSIKP